MNIIKRGICGTCVWELDDEKTLVIRPQNGKSGVMQSDRGWPWRTCCHIKRVVIEDGVKTGTYAGKMFAGMDDCTMFNVKKLDVSAAENMHGMFNGCSSMENTAGLEKWDVSNVADMSYMFYGCSSLKDISALAGWDVSEVCDMGSMFGFCSLLTDISLLKKWNISNVTNTCCMFRSCKSLTDISPLSGWDMSDIREKDGMFACTNINYDVLDAFIPMACPREGSFIGYKKCRDERIVQLEVPEDARRSSAYGKKCRCDRAKVLGIWTLDGEETEYAVSIFDPDFVYYKGKAVEVQNFNKNRFNECAVGIHFFMTRKEAEDYVW